MTPKQIDVCDLIVSGTNERPNGLQNNYLFEYVKRRCTSFEVDGKVFFQCLEFLVEMKLIKGYNPTNGQFNVILSQKGQEAAVISFRKYYSDIKNKEEIEHLANVNAINNSKKALRISWISIILASLAFLFELFKWYSAIDPLE